MPEVSGVIRCFRPFPLAAHMRARSEMDVGTAQADQFGHAQAGLSREPKHGMVAPPGPSRPSGGCKQCVEFRFSQEGNEPSVEALGGMASTRSITAACSG